MRAAVTTGPRQVSVEQVPDPTLDDTGAVIDVGAVGLCGSDLHMWAGDRHDTGFPLRQGHEVGGHIAALPAAYRGPLKVGQTVTVDPAVPCRWCRPCRRGSWWACRAFESIGNTMPGGLADQVEVPLRQIHPTPGLDVVEAALCEPFSIAAMALHRAELQSSARVAVIGGGPIGLALTLTAAARGFEVLVSEPAASRRHLARRLGADVVTTPEQLAGTVLEWTQGDGADVVIEASGTRSGLSDALAAVGDAGRLVVVGVAGHDLVIPVPRLLFQGVTLAGARGGLFPPAVDVVTSNRAAVRELVSRRFDLDDVAAGFRYTADHADLNVKTIVDVHRS